MSCAFESVRCAAGETPDTITVGARPRTPKTRPEGGRGQFSADVHSEMHLKLPGCWILHAGVEEFCLHGAGHEVLEGPIKYGMNG